MDTNICLDLVPWVWQVNSHFWLPSSFCHPTDHSSWRYRLREIEEAENKKCTFTCSRLDVDILCLECHFVPCLPNAYSDPGLNCHVSSFRKLPGLVPSLSASGGHGTFLCSASLSSPPLDSELLEGRCPLT